MPCGRYSLLAASGGFASRFLMELVSNRQRVLEGPKCSWVLPAASRLSFQSSGCSPRPPRSRSEDWWVRQAKDDAEGGDVTAAFRTEGSKGRIAGWAGRWIGCVVWRCGRGSKWFVSIRRHCRGSKLKEGSKARDRLTKTPRLQGAFVTRSGCTQSWAGPGGSRGCGRVGGLLVWALGTWTWVGKTDPFPFGRKGRRSNCSSVQLPGSSSLPCCLPGRLRPIATYCTYRTRIVG